MIKRRNPVVIGNVGAYTENMSLELQTALTKLTADVNSISESYQGVDANIEIAQFLETIKKINTIVRNFEYYGKYMKNVASCDNENLNSTKKKLDSSKQQMIIENPALQTLTLDSIISNNLRK